MNRTELENHHLLQKPWSQRIELAEGVFTPGRDSNGVGMLKDLLALVGANEGGRATRALDANCADGLFGLLLQRKGFETTMFSEWLRPQWIDLVARALETEFDVLESAHLETLPYLLAERREPAFDLVIYGAGLQRSISPVAALMTLRGVVRDGGLVLVETLASNAEEPVLHVAPDEAAAATMVPSRSGLLSALNAAALAPLRAFALPPVLAGGDRRIGRMAVACRARDRSQLPEKNPFGSALARNLDWQHTRSQLAPLPFAGDEIPPEGDLPERWSPPRDHYGALLLSEGRSSP